MKTATSLLLILTLALFFSLPPISLSSLEGILPHAEDTAETVFGKVAPKILPLSPDQNKGIRFSTTAHKRAKKADKIIGGGRPSAENQLDDLDLPTVNITVGNPPQLVVAHLSISSLITSIETYPSCLPKFCGSLGRGYLVKDTIWINSDIEFPITFVVSAIGCCTSPLPLTKGIINFSKNEMSVVSNLKVGFRRFSYFIPYKISRPASVLFSNQVLIHSGVQSTYQVPIPRSPHLYGVPLTQISVNNDNCLLNPQADLYGGVSLSTDVLETMLAPVAYNEVKSKILQHMGTLTAIIPNMRQYEMCYYMPPQAPVQWPDLTLSFAGAYGAVAQQMVLRKENYVIRYDATGLECAAIIPSTSLQGLSVIGTMAQRNREMIFDNDSGMVHFDRVPALIPSD